MDISVEELLLLENLTYIDENFRKAIGKDLNLAVQHAADFLSFVIETTLNEGTDPHEGVLLEGCLWKLLVPQTKDCTSCKG